MKGNSTRGKLEASEIKAKTAAIVNIQVNLKLKFYPRNPLKYAWQLKEKMVTLFGGALNIDIIHMTL